MAARAYRTKQYLAMKAWLDEYVVPCVWCGRRATTPDHCPPVALGGTDADLVPSCRPCNAKRGAQLAKALRQARARTVQPAPSRVW